MRLNSIKLSGFKSFADPTHFQLPGQLVGVVGPNGCGKSNIMDAVRWVLGESKASELRGESMQDVIFNGSGQRKPASRASVELVFSNEDARAGGQWNRVLIGMGSIVMDEAEIGEGSVIAAGAVVTQNTKVEPGSLMAGVPAKRIGPVSTDLSANEIERIAQNYLMYAGWFKEG